MKQTRKVTSLMLCLAMLLGCIALFAVGCSKPEQEIPTISFTENGQSAYKIIRMDYDPNKTVTNACVALRDAIEAATGAYCELQGDWVNRGEAIPTDTPEILVGETNRQESIDTLSTLGENEYVIKVVGKRLVIIGQTEQATAEAVNVFIKNILGYNETDGSYAASDLKLPENHNQSGKYTPPVIPDKPGKPSTPGVYGPQDAQTIPFKSYVTPTYQLKNGAYIQSYEGFEVSGVRTTFQANTLYADVYNINTDSVMVYSTADANFQSWYSSGDYVVDMMIAINRAGKDYLDRDEDNYNDIQMDSSGNYIVHTENQAWYMVPSLDWIEYAWEEMLKPMIETYHPQTIALEEPEMWIRSGYSETFKEEWEDFYGEDWEAPSSSAAANLKANLLKTYLFERILIELSKRAKELDPTIQIYVASHSTVNYTAWNINAGLNTYLATGAIDGVIGQTWADTHNSAFKYNGQSIRDNYTNAFIEYCSYVDSVEGTNFYALADPMADGNYTEEDLQYIYRQSVAAKLMQPEIHRFQVLPWVQRAFANVSADYRTVQSQIYEMLNKVGGEEITMSAGTPGIAYLASDSLSWMNAGSGWALSTSDGMYGLCAPLLRDGIPVKMKAMEQIYKADDLKGVNLLVVSFDSSVPLSEEVNIALAEWVKAGGTMLYIAGQNDYWDIDDYFFWADDVTPLDNLLGHLGLGDITVNTEGINLSSALTSTDADLSAAFKDVKVPVAYNKYAVTFSGAAAPILRSGATTLGFEASVGKGHVVMVGLPSAMLASVEGGSTFMRALTAYALQYTDFEYVSTSLMVTERGDYTIAHAYGEDEYLNGEFIDLFDSNLSILIDPDVPKDDSVILYDISGIKRDIPRLGYTSGQVLSLTESTAKTSIQLTSAANVNVAIRMLLPAGVYPASVTVTDADGKSYPVLAYFYDEKNDSCLFKIDGNSDTVTVTMDWGNDPDTYTLIAKEFIEDSYLTNQNDAQDAEFIEPETTAAANHGVRFCDGSLQLIYKFDLAQYDTPLFRFHISQNYYVEVSADKSNWQLVADYSNGGTVDRVVNGANAEVISIDPADYGLTDVMYFRLKNTATTGGFGGAISSFSIRHMVEKEGDAELVDAPENRLTGVNNTTQNVKDTVNRNAVASDAKYLVSTKDGIATYRRSMKTTSAGEDNEFIYANTSNSTNTLRFCDGDRVLIYFFDISDKLSMEISMNVFQNYIVEVSADGEDWEEIANYYDISGGKHLTSGGNNVTIRIDPMDYDCDETGVCYVRLRNCDPSQGHGGSITQLTLNYTKAAK